MKATKIKLLLGKTKQGKNYVGMKVTNQDLSINSVFFNNAEKKGDVWIFRNGDVILYLKLKNEGITNAAVDYFGNRYMLERDRYGNWSYFEPIIAVFDDEVNAAIDNELKARDNHTSTDIANDTASNNSIDDDKFPF